MALGRPDPYPVKVVAWLAPHPLSCVSVGAVCVSVLFLVVLSPLSLSPRCLLKRRKRLRLIELLIGRIQPVLSFLGLVDMDKDCIVDTRLLAFLGGV